MIFETSFFLLYRFVFWPIAITVVWLTKRFNKKWQRLFAERLNYLKTPTKTPTKSHAQSHDRPLRSFTAPPIWIHAASGEFEYAKPIIRKIKELKPEQPIVVTYFSPSYREAIAKTPGVDGLSPLPLDLPGPVRTFFEHMHPSALLVARTDVWPEVMVQARQRKLPTLLFSATVKQYRGLRRWYEKWILSKFSRIFVVSATDQDELRTLGLQNVEVHGDTRFDQVIYRLEHPKPLPPIHDRFNRQNDRPILIAGSTWPEDEAVLIRAAQSFLHENKLRLVIAPHELNRLDQLAALLKAAKIEFELYSQLSSTNLKVEHEVIASVNSAVPVLIVDQVGILAELYAIGDFAFVGGSFRQKVHSVMEPLAAGLTTLVGPHHANNREAVEFQNVKTDLGSAVQLVESPEQMTYAIASILAQRSNWDKAKTLIRNEIHRRAGGTDAVLSWLKSVHAV